MPGKRTILLLMTFACLMLFSAEAQCRTTRVGVVLTRHTPFYELTHTEFLKAISEAGFNNKIEFIIQRPAADPVAWANTTRKLIAAEVDFIITYGEAATLLALREKPRVPVIYIGLVSDEPAILGDSRTAGTCTRLPVANLLRYLDASTSDKNLNILFCSIEPQSESQQKSLSELSIKYGFSPVSIDVTRVADIPGRMASISSGSLVITTSSLLASSYDTIMEITKNKKIPTISLNMTNTLSSTIMLSPLPSQHGKGAARKLIALINGDAPAKLDKECSKDFDLVFNLGDAQRTGFKIPMHLVTEATRLVQ